LVRTFDRWIASQQMSLTHVDERTVDTVLDEHAAGRRQRGSGSTLHRLLTYLRTRGVARPMVVVADESPLAQLEHRYQHYLRAERGLCATTVQTFVGVLRQLVTEHAGEAAASVATVGARDVATFVRRHARAASPGRAQLMTTALRAMFRFFFHVGEIPVDLSVAVPTVPDWRLARLPRSLAPEDVERLLIACDQQTATGRRDYAISATPGAAGAPRRRGRGA
jgi:site-specific recombinase XerD